MTTAAQKQETRRTTAFEAKLSLAAAGDVVAAHGELYNEL